MIEIDISLILRILAIIPIIALFLAPLESVGWWNGWWFKDSQKPEQEFKLTNLAVSNNSDYSRVVFYLTGIGGASDKNNVPLEQDFLSALKAKLSKTKVIDAIYPYSVINRPLTDGRLLAKFWRFALKAKQHGKAKIGFLINLRNLFQVLLAADDRYGTFFYQGAASIMVKKLLEIAYDPESEIPIYIIGYSGGGQVAAGAGPYLARVVKAPVTVISLGGVVSSNPLVDRIDRLVHIVSNKDKVAKLGFIFAGRWPINYFSAWNRAKRKKRIKLIRLEQMQHDGKGGYLDRDSKLANGQSYFDKTLETIATELNKKVEAIPDIENLSFADLIEPNKPKREKS